MSHDEARTAPPANAETDSQLRAKAVKRSWICPGAGYALLGRAGLAVVTFISSLATLLALGWLAFHPGPESTWIVVAALGVATILWIAEQQGLKRMAPREPGPNLLFNGFVFSSAVYWCGCVATLAIVYSQLGSLRLAGGGMSPTISDGERLVYQKRVRPDRLRRGIVVAFKLSNRTGWGQPGALVISRILAIPGDELSMRGGKYLINGEARTAVGDLGKSVPVIGVPMEPGRLRVPAGSYFVVQDSPGKALDSRVLSWVQPEDLVSTQIYHLSTGAFFKRVD